MYVARWGFSTSLLVFLIAVVVLPYLVCKFSWLLGHFCSGLIPLMWTKTFGMLLAVCGRWLRCLPLRLGSMVTPSVTSWQSISLLARNLRILSPLPTIVMWVLETTITCALVYIISAVCHCALLHASAWLLQIHSWTFTNLSVHFEFCRCQRWCALTTSSLTFLRMDL